MFISKFVPSHCSTSSR